MLDHFIVRPLCFKNDNAITGDRFLDIEFQIFRFLDKLVQVGRIGQISQIGLIGEQTSPRPFFEGCKVRSPVSGVWSPYGRKTEEAEDMDAELQDGLEGVIYFQRPKARAKVVKLLYVLFRFAQTIIAKQSSTYSPLFSTGAPSNITVAFCGIQQVIRKYRLCQMHLFLIH